MATPKRKTLLIGAIALAALAGYGLWAKLQPAGLPEGIAGANGRIEATEIDIAALSGGRILRIGVAEGELVAAGDVLVQMDTAPLDAQLRQGQAQLRRAEVAVETATAMVAHAEAQARVAEAGIEQARALAELAAQRHARTQSLFATNAASQQMLEDDLARDRQAAAQLASAEASHAAALAGVSSARAQVIDAEAAIEAAQAAIEATEVLIGDATLLAPRAGRIQYRIAQEGEIVGAGGRILSLVDVSDVYMTVYLPTSQAGRVQLGSEVRLLLDALPGIAIPATVSFVADVAQFTPRTVETADEREKLMFRLRARVEPELLQRYLQHVRTGLPGMAYVRLDSAAEWPAFLANVVQ